jgi:hypothetical protein
MSYGLEICGSFPASEQRLGGGGGRGEAKRSVSSAATAMCVDLHFNNTVPLTSGPIIFSHLKAHVLLNNLYSSIHS